MWELTLVLALVLVVVVWLGNKRYQALQKQNHAIWLQVEAQLNRRYDWVPLWVQTAKCIFKQEITALKAVIEARQAATRALKNIRQRPEHSPAMQEWLRAEAHFTQSLRELRAFVRSTPELQNHPDLFPLRAELLGIESELHSACCQYNHTVSFYNQYKQNFPQNLLALVLGHNQDALLLPVDETIALETPAQ
jgi:LemA protein